MGDITAGRLSLSSVVRPRNARRMLRIHKMPLLTLTVLLVASALWLAWPRPEVTYQGKPMSQWLRELEPDSIRAKSEAVGEL